MQSFRYNAFDREQHCSSHKYLFHIYNEQQLLSVQFVCYLQDIMKQQS